MKNQNTGIEENQSWLINDKKDLFRKSLGAFTVVLATMSGPVMAEQRQHDAHEHGHAILNAAQDGNEVEVSIEVPAMDMVGFEHQPENEQQKALIEKIEAALLKGGDVISFAKTAECHLEKAKVESALLSDHDDHEGHEGHEEHADHEEHGGHSEFEITYHFHCDKPAKLSGFELKLFNVSSSLQEVDVNWFGETAVKKAELSPKQSVMTF